MNFNIGNNHQIPNLDKQSLTTKQKLLVPLYKRRRGQIERLRERVDFHKAKERRERERKRERRVVSELSDLKGVLLARIMEGNTNKMMSLNGTNYHLWKGKMKDLLFVKKMHLPVFATQKPKSMFDEEWDFEHQQFKEGTSLLDHLNEFQGIIDQMSGMGIKFEDEILGLLLLNSLPESWETFK
ncbi:hypothetical protein CR513_37142, partial [Mucuna pruriens]